MQLDKQNSFKLFDEIASTYDRVNRIMTFGQDTFWRKKLYNFIPENCENLFDGATGTADQILFLLEKGLQAKHIVGIDLSEAMLEIGMSKIKSKYPNENITLRKASLLDIPYNEESFDAATVSFGVRNVPDITLCLQELHRILKKEGICLILECSKPKNPLIVFLHKLYMEKIMPAIGGMCSSNKGAYQYLNASSSTFPCGEDFLKLLENAGFKNCEAHPLSLGAVSLYVARK